VLYALAAFSLSFPDAAPCGLDTPAWGRGGLLGVTQGEGRGTTTDFEAYRIGVERYTLAYEREAGVPAG
jgi:hypothetical protein